MEPSVFVCPVVMGADLDREREKHPAEPGLLIFKREEIDGQGVGT